MANVSSANLHYVGPGFANNVEIHRVIYDFTVDGGASADVIRLLQFKSACTLVWGYAKVLTTCTSGGSATVIVGVTADTDAIMDATAGAVANLAAGFIDGNSATPVKIAADDYLLLDIGTADLTAGKIEVVIGLLP